MTILNAILFLDKLSKMTVTSSIIQLTRKRGRETEVPSPRRLEKGSVCCRFSVDVYVRPQQICTCVIRSDYKKIWDTKTMESLAQTIHGINSQS